MHCDLYFFFCRKPRTPISMSFPSPHRHGHHCPVLFCNTSVETIIIAIIIAINQHHCPVLVLKATMHRQRMVEHSLATLQLDRHWLEHLQFLSGKYSYIVHYVLFTSGVSIVLMPSRSLKSKSRTGNGPPSLVHLLMKMVQHDVNSNSMHLFARVRDLVKITIVRLIT